MDSTLEIIGRALAGVVFMSVFVEGAVAYFLTEPLHQWKKMSLAEYVIGYAPRYVAALLGVLFSWGFRIDLPAIFGLEAAPGLTYFVTGIVLGRGSNYLHHLLSAVRSVGK